MTRKNKLKKIQGIYVGRISECTLSIFRRNKHVGRNLKEFKKINALTEK